MPSLGDYSAIRDQLDVDIREAWPDTKKVYFGFPELAVKQADHPYAVVILDTVEGEFATVRNVHQNYNFTILYIEQRPNGNINLTDRRVEFASALSLILERNTEYAGVGMMPLVHKVDLVDPTSSDDGSHAVVVHFRCLVDRAWGT